VSQYSCRILRASAYSIVPILVTGLAGCANHTDEVRTGTRAARLTTSDAGTARSDAIFITPASIAEEVAVTLRSDEPIPPPLTIPLSEPARPPQREVYHRHLDLSTTVRLIVRVVSSRAGSGGLIHQMSVLRSSAPSLTGPGPSGEFSDRDFFFDDGLACQGIRPVARGEVLMVHARRAHLADPSAVVIPIATVVASPGVNQVTERDGEYLVHFPWGLESFSISDSPGERP
jgi:hypothetical protein